MVTLNLVDLGDFGVKNRGFSAYGCKVDTGGHDDGGDDDGEEDDLLHVFLSDPL